MDHVDDVFFDVCACSEVVEVEHFEFEAESDALDDDVFRVQITMVFSELVYVCEAACERVEQVQCHEWLESFSGLSCEVLAEQFSFDEFGYQECDGLFVEVHVLAVVVDEDVAVSELV